MANSSYADRLTAAAREWRRAHQLALEFEEERRRAETLRFCQWILDMLGYKAGDQLDDLFPGTAVMSRVLSQQRLAV